METTSPSSRPLVELSASPATAASGRPSGDAKSETATAPSSRPREDAGVLYMPILLTGPTATPVGGTVTVAWTLNTSGPAGYHRVHYRLVGAGTWTTTAWSGASGYSASVAISGLASGNYEYQIESATGPGYIWTMGWLPATPGTYTIAPSFVLEITGVNWTIGKTTLGVLYNTNAATKCRISYKKATDFLWQQLSVETSYHAGGHSHTLSGLTVGTVYWIRIHVYDAAGNHDWSPSETGYFIVKTHSSSGTGGGYIGIAT